MACVPQPQELGGCRIEMLNVAVGPSGRYLDFLFARQEIFDEVFEKHPFQNFLGDLCPQMTKISADTMYEVSTYQCVLPDVHNSLETLLAIKRAPNRDILDLPGCQVIIKHAFRGIQRHADLMIVEQFFTIFMFFFLAASLRQEDWPLLGPPRLYAIILYPLAIRSAFWESTQCLGFISARFGGEYFQDLGNYVDAARILLNLLVLTMVLVKDVEAKDYVWFRVCLAILTFNWWNK